MAAASYKSFPIVLLVVFATVVAPTLQQTAAVGVQGAAATKAHVAAPAPSPRGAPIHLKGGMFSDFPCFPFLPKILRDLCYALFRPQPPSPSPPPRPEECRSPLKNRLVSSCTGFLTNSSVPEPPPNACCHDIKSFFNGTDSPFCLCHVANGNIGELLSAPLIRSRTVTVVAECDIGLNADKITDICINNPRKFLSSDYIKGSSFLICLRLSED